MEKRLLILLSDSDFDRERLKRHPGWPNSFTAYLNCDDTPGCADNPIEAASRLLCVCKLSRDRAENTAAVVLVIERCAAWTRRVIGTHTGLEKPEQVLDLSKLPDVPVHNYSTGSENYCFVKDWCTLLAQHAPCPEIARDYDRLFECLSQGKPITRVRDKFDKAQHDLQGALRPFCLELETLQRDRFATGLRSLSEYHYSPLERARKALYGDSPSASEVALQGAAAAPASRAAEIRARLDHLQSLVPRTDDQENADPLFHALFRFLEAVITPPEAASIPALVSGYLDWSKAVQSAIEALANEMRLAPEKATTAGSSE